MILGDVLAEHFRLKAQLIRIRFGLVVIIIWALCAFAVLFARVIFGLWVLKAINAPKWLWIVWALAIPCGLLIEQIEKIEGKP